MLVRTHRAVTSPSHPIRVRLRAQGVSGWVEPAQGQVMDVRSKPAPPGSGVASVRPRHHGAGQGWTPGPHPPPTGGELCWFPGCGHKLSSTGWLKTIESCCHGSGGQKFKPRGRQGRFPLETLGRVPPCSLHPPRASDTPWLQLFSACPRGHAASPLYSLFSRRFQWWDFGRPLLHCDLHKLHLKAPISN